MENINIPSLDKVLASIEALFLSNMPEPPRPAVQRICRIISDELRLTILLALRRNRDNPLTFKGIRNYIDMSRQGKLTPASSLSNFLSECEQGLLIQKDTNSRYSLTALGVKALEAYYITCSILLPTLKDSWDEQRTQDLGPSLGTEQVAELREADDMLQDSTVTPEELIPERNQPFDR